MLFSFTSPLTSFKYGVDLSVVVVELLEDPLGEALEICELIVLWSCVCCLPDNTYLSQVLL